jgi:hypothetical protein
MQRRFKQEQYTDVENCTLSRIPYNLFAGQKNIKDISEEAYHFPQPVYMGGGLTVPTPDNIKTSTSSMNLSDINLSDINLSAIQLKLDAILTKKNTLNVLAGQLEQHDSNLTVLLNASKTNLEQQQQNESECKSSLIVNH